VSGEAISKLFRNEKFLRIARPTATILGLAAGIWHGSHAWSAWRQSEQWKAADPALSDFFWSAFQTELRAVMRDVGHRLAESSPAPSGDLAARAERASQLLNALGGVTTVERGPGGHLRITGCSCPLSVAVNERAEVCLAVQTMLRDVMGVTVREECDRSERPRCHFAVVS
jgi:hypothetical protein